MSSFLVSHRRRGILAAIQATLIVVSLFAPIPSAAADPAADPSASPAPTVDPSATPTPTPDPTPTPTPDPTPTPEPSTAPAPVDPPVPLIVTFASGVSAADQAAVLASAGATDVDAIPQLRMHAVTLPAASYLATVDALRADPSVTRVDFDTSRAAEAAPSDAQYADQWSLLKIGWDQAFGTVAPSGTATVAILDTGIDESHPDLAGNVLAGTSILDGSDGRTDPNGHGTWLAGIIAAQTDNAIGIAGVGYAGVRVMPVTVLGPDGTGQDSDIIAGVVYAADHGADVILMAFSNYGYSASLQAAIDYAWSKGAVLVAAVGNDGLSTPAYPAGDRGVIGVSATDQTDALWASSNYGADTFLAAPGTDILTTAAGGFYSSVTGTSASAAEVAAAAALAKAVDPSASNGVIVGRLARTADAVGTAEQTGNGRLNLARAIADTSTDAVIPAGAPGGGPLVGPYVAALTRNLALTFAGTGSGSVKISVLAGQTVNAPTSCGGTGTDLTSQTVTSTCSPNITLTTSGSTSPTATFLASPSGGSIFAGWSAQSGLSSSTCSGTTNSCSAVLGANPALTATFNLSNTAPVITSNGGGAAGTTSVAENTTAVTTVTATDPEGDSLTYSISGGADAAKFSVVGATGVLTFVAAPDFEAPGDANTDNVYEVTVKASDGSLFDTQALSVTVTNVNEAPTGTDKTVTTLEDTAYTFAAADFGFTDVDAGDTLSAVRIDTLSLAAGSTLRLSGVDVAAAQVILTADIGNLVFTPAANANGAGYASFTFSVRDTGGPVFDPSPNTLTIDVTAVNDAPVADPVSGSVGHLDAGGVEMALSATDVEGDPLTYSLVGANGGAAQGTVTIVGSIAHYTPTGDFVGTDSFSYRAYDGLAYSVAATGTVTLTNVAPTATVILGDHGPKTNDTLTATATTADADGDPVTLTYVWRNGSTVVRTTAGTSSLTDTLDLSAAGKGDKGDTITVEVTPNDGHINGTPTSDSATVTNSAPVVTLSGAASADEGDSVHFTFTTSDADPSESFSLLGASCGGAGSLVAPATFSTSDGSGSYDCAFPDGPATSGVSVEVKDSDGTPSDATISVTVNNVDPTVTLDPGNTYTWPESASAERTFAYSATDPAGVNDPLTITIGCGTGGAYVALSDTGSSFKCVFADGPASPTVSVSATDGDGGSGSDTHGVTVANVAPTVTLSGPAAANEGDTKSYSYTFTDPGADTWTRSVSCGAHGVVSDDTFTPGTKSGSFKCTWSDNFLAEAVSATVTDDDTGTDTKTISVDVNNVAPASVTLTSSAASILENGSLSLSGVFTDPGVLDTHTVVIDWGDGSATTTLTLAAGVLTFGPASHTYLDDNPTGTASDSYPIGVTITDKDGGIGSGSTSVTVNNVAPVITSVTGPADPLASPATPTVSAAFTDVGSLDVHTCTFAWDDGSTSTVTALGTGNGSCSASHAYSTAGVYTVGVTVRDDDTGVATSRWEFVVVYDPSAGFVTGGGWINSLAGSYTPENTSDPDLIGKATFGFVSKYQKGASVPVGQTESQFQVANFNFHSESYQWLVVSGYKAQYRGTGTVNGAAGYSFLVTAYDGQVSGGTVDKFRIRIWLTSTSTVVYDNKYGTSTDMDAADPQALGGGSIVIHK